jgi:hypothetical protein
METPFLVEEMNSGGDFTNFEGEKEKGISTIIFLTTRPSETATSH